MFKNKAVILAKIQTGIGVDATPTGATNAILCEEPTWEALDSKVERANIKPSFGAQRFVSVGEGQRLSFSTELKGSGVATTVPEIGPLFRGCGMTQTVDATPGTENTTYAPNSAGTAGEYLTLYYYVDGIVHKMVDCRGTFSLDGKVNQYVKIKWEFTGVYAGPVAGALPTATWNDTVPPMFRAAAFAFDSYAAIIDGISIDMKNDIVKQPDLNAATGIKQWYIKERTVTGKIEPEMVPPATKDFFGMWQGGDAHALTCTVGASSGNRCIITAPAVQIDKPSYGSRENILTVAIPLVFTPSTVDDEISFKFD
jgi:hypothetical protein